MAKARAARERQANRARGRATGRGGRPAGKPKPWGKWALWAVAAAGVIAIGVYLVSVAGQSSSEDPEVTALASANADGSPIEVFTGSRHTVYHSPVPLPTESSPRADGRPTLVWFSAVTCEFCEEMEPWAHETASQFQDRLVFVEKSTRHDRTAIGTYAVFGTPTFVLIDAQGREVDRFNFLRSPEAFAARIESALGLHDARQQG